MIEISLHGLEHRADFRRAALRMAKDLENRLPEDTWIHLFAKPNDPHKRKFLVHLDIKSLGRRIFIKQSSSLFTSALRRAKRKALRKLRGKKRPFPRPTQPIRETLQSA